MQGKENLDETLGSRNRKYLFHQDFRFCTAGIALKRREEKRKMKRKIGPFRHVWERE
jgi:hypothetical protein